MLQSPQRKSPVLKSSPTASKSSPGELLPCQRHLFSIPDDVAYFNTAYLGPTLNKAVERGHFGINRKSRPWTVTPDHFFDCAVRMRELFGRLLNVASQNIALVSGASYGVQIAAKNVEPYVRSGQSIVLLHEQFPSNVYAWQEVAERKNLEIIRVKRDNADQDWTPLVLDAITDNTSIVTLPQLHWADGSLLDLVKIGERAREVGAFFCLDLTQSVGVIPTDLQIIKPDFVIVGGYKWLLGPHGITYMYVADKWFSGETIEKTWAAREGSSNFSTIMNYTDQMRPGAVRFDVSGPPVLHLYPSAVASLEQVVAWGVENIYVTLREKSDQIARRAKLLGLSVSSAPRSPHIIGLLFNDGVPTSLVNKLKDNKVYVSVRGKSIRVSVYLFTTQNDIDRLFGTINDYMTRNKL